MNTVLDALKAFLEDAHKNGTDCNTAELHLMHAKGVHQSANKEDKDALDLIIAELEQVHNVCLIQRNEEDDGFECGV